MTRLNLLIDADDTLWENNVYFEEAFEHFVAFLRHPTLTAPEIRAVLDEIELANSRVHGYGSLNFGHNLQQCFRRLACRPVHSRDLETVLGFALRILDQPVVLLDDVAATLEYLASRHSLTLCTKGHPDEQAGKLARSGLSPWFTHTAIVKEKDHAAYESLVRDRGLDKSRTWMIGNSPKSDINPALQAGLHAVFVPHARTWSLERQQLRQPGPGRLLVIEQFPDLRRLF